MLPENYAMKDLMFLRQKKEEIDKSRRKVPFMPVIGVLSGVASTVIGFVFARNVKNIVSETLSSAAAGFQDDSDIFSYFFGGAQTQTVDNTQMLLAKLIELCGKGFGLLLIVLGLFIVFHFASIIEKKLSSPDTILLNAIYDELTEGKIRELEIEAGVNRFTGAPDPMFNGVQPPEQGCCDPGCDCCNHGE